MGKPENVRCGTCVFFSLHEREPPEGRVGSCKRRPPSTYVKGSEHEYSCDEWWTPAVVSDDWCGEWAGEWPKPWTVTHYEDPVKIAWQHEDDDEPGSLLDRVRAAGERPATEEERPDGS